MLLNKSLALCGAMACVAVPTAAVAQNYASFRSYASLKVSEDIVPPPSARPVVSAATTAPKTPVVSQPAVVSKPAVVSATAASPVPAPAGKAPATAAPVTSVVKPAGSAAGGLPVLLGFDSSTFLSGNWGLLGNLDYLRAILASLIGSLPTPIEKPDAGNAPAPTSPASPTSPIAPPEAAAPQPIAPEPVAPEPVVPEAVVPETVVPEPVPAQPAPPQPAVPVPVVPQLPASPGPSAPAAGGEEAGAGGETSVVDTVVEVITDIVDTVTDVVTEIVESVVDAVTGSGEEPAATATDGVSLPATTPEAGKPEAEIPATTAQQPPAQVPAAAVALPAVEKTFEVGNLTELRAALKEAQPLSGAIIRLRSGNYGDLVWSNKKHLNGWTYLLPVDGAEPKFTSINFAGSQGLFLQGITVQGNAKILVNLNSGKDLVISGSRLLGTNANRNPWDDQSNSIQVRFSTGVTIVNNIFQDLRKALYIQRSQKVQVYYNKISFVREGINVAAATDLVLEGNHFHDFYPNYGIGEHPDAMQLWTNGETVGSVRVRIANNVLSFGEKRAVQGVLAGCEAKGARHSDWVVTNNVYYGSSPHGLSFYCIDNLKISNNVVVGSPHAEQNNSIRSADGTMSGGYMPKIRTQQSTGVEAWNNVGSNLPVFATETVGSQWDNWKVQGSSSDVTPWGEIFSSSRPTGNVPELAVFVTRSPSLAASKSAGILAPFRHGASSKPTAEALAEAQRLHRN